MNSILMLVLGDMLLSAAAVYAGAMVRFGSIEVLWQIDFLQMLIFVGSSAFISNLLELYNMEKHIAGRELLLRILIGIAGTFFTISAVSYLLVGGPEDAGRKRHELRPRDPRRHFPLPVVPHPAVEQMTPETLRVLLIFLPVAGAAALLFAGRASATAVKSFGMAVSVAAFVVSLGVAAAFDPEAPGFQMVTRVPWVADLSISFQVGIDGMSLLLILLTTFMTPIALLAS